MGRILAPYFGSSIFVWGAASITVCHAVFVYRFICAAENYPCLKPDLRLYGSFFVCAAILLVPLVFAGNEIMEAVFLRIEDPRYGSLVVSMLLFFLPTAIMGMIAPYSVRLLVISTDGSGHVAGKLYFYFHPWQCTGYAGDVFLSGALVRSESDTRYHVPGSALRGLCCYYDRY